MFSPDIENGYNNVWLNTIKPHETFNNVNENVACAQGK